MGLDISIKGLDYKDRFRCSYIGFGAYRRELVKAYNPILSKIYDETYKREMTQEESQIWNELCNNDLDILIWHSDCDGELSPKECKKIYNVIKDFKILHQELHEKFLKNLKYCFENNKTMYFT